MQSITTGHSSSTNNVVPKQRSQQFLLVFTKVYGFGAEGKISGITSWLKTTRGWITSQSREIMSQLREQLSSERKSVNETETDRMFDTKKIRGGGIKN